jgi:hypothetical protein
MSEIEYVNEAIQGWETVADGAEKIVLHEGRRKRVLLRIAAGKAYPEHADSVPNEFLLWKAFMWIH